MKINERERNDMNGFMFLFTWFLAGFVANVFFLIAILRGSEYDPDFFNLENIVSAILCLCGGYFSLTCFASCIVVFVLSRIVGFLSTCFFVVKQKALQLEDITNEKLQLKTKSFARTLWEFANIGKEIN